MNYLELTINITPWNEINNDIICSMLGEIGFESFLELENGCKAYIKQNLFDEENLKNIISEYPFDAQIEYLIEAMEDKNWNEEWEKNHFQPQIYDGKCIVQSTKHNISPDDYQYNIYINPKLAFGTGHHQTTSLIIKELLDSDIAGKSVLDMGCGTAILAILASMRGAKSATAIDIDKWSYDNALENLKLNDITNIKVELGDADILGKESFDLIIANINRNILLADIHKYASVLNPNGELIMSGFYTEDVHLIEKECNKCNLKLIKTEEKENWCMVKFTLN